MILLNRRNLLKGAFAGFGSCALQRMIKPTFSFAQSPGNGDIAIFVNLLGGCDGAFAFPYLSTIGQEIFQRRPTIGIDLSTVLTAEANLIGFHPAWGTAIGGRSIYNEYQAGRAKLMLRIGPENFISGSHTAAQNFVSRGGATAGQGGGWFARTVEEFDLAQMTAFGFNTPLTVDFQTSELGRIPVCKNIEQLQFVDRSTALGGTRESAYSRDISRQLAQLSGQRSTVDRRVADALESVHGLVSEFEPIRAVVLANESSYPNSDFGKAMKSVAKIVAYYRAHETVPKNRIFHVTRPGFDSHKSELIGLTNGITDLAQSFAAFIADMTALACYNQVKVLCFSEFGRKLFENGGGGTDHGYGNTLLAFGGQINGGVVGDPPSLTEVRDETIFSVSTAFQNPFAEILESMGYDASRVFPSFTRRNLNLA